MYPRTNYEMTEEQLEVLLEASKSVPAMMIGGSLPPSPQENSNRAWNNLGIEMGFDYMTVKPIDGKSYRFLTAVPNETEEQKADRVSLENVKKEKARVKQLRTEIKERESELKRLTHQTV